jgi:flagellar FliJ protein
VFHFPLQPLLNHRRHLEETLQKEMAALQQALEAERRRADDLCRDLIDRRRRLADMQRDGDTAQNLLIVVNYLRHLEVAITRQEKVIQDAAQRVSGKRGELVEAVKRRKVIEKLKEHARKDYDAGLRHKEMRLINEIAIGRFNRARSGGGQTSDV